MEVVAETAMVSVEEAGELTPDMVGEGREKKNSKIEEAALWLGFNQALIPYRFG